MSPGDVHRLDDAVRVLPFPLDDYAAVNDTFAEWRESDDGGTKRTIDVWVYCYIQRYFLLHFVRERGAVTGFDTCVSRAMTRAQKGYDRVEDPRRFANYISVVCKNTLRNYRRDRRHLAELPVEVPVEERMSMAEHDRRLVRFNLARRIADMPESIRGVGELRFLRGMEYTDIAAELNMAVPTVRTYARRVASRLQEDAGLRELR